MKCPHCGTPERVRVKVCPSCGEAYASQDLLEESQLAFLLEQTARWNVPQSLRAPYVERLSALRNRLSQSRLRPVEPAPPEPAADVVAELPPEPVRPEPVAEVVVEPVSEPALPEPAVEIVAEPVPEPAPLEPAVEVVAEPIPEPAAPEPVVEAIAEPPEPAPPEPADEAIAELVPEIAAPELAAVQPAPLAPPAAERAVPVPEPAAPPAPPKEKVPFDQWLLSERNIKIALYTGGLLLVLAGAIFVGVRWAYFSGPLKFAITLLVTGLMYLGGYLLFQRPAFRIGGIALLGIASAFLTLNFAVLQIHVLGPRGLRHDVMWLIASPFCLLLYTLTAYWARSDLFTYLGLIALGSTVAAAMVVGGAPALAYLPAAALLFLAVLILAKALLKTPWAAFTRWPLLIVSQAGMPCAIGTAVVLWLTETGCAPCEWGSPLLALSAIGVGVLFYVTTYALFEWLVAQWVGALLLPVTIVLVSIELGMGATAIGIALMVLALAYMGVGVLLERREGRGAGVWPLYILAYLMAAYVTALSLPKTADLALALVGDVALLVVSAAIFRKRWFVYAAVWLFMLPVYLILTLYVPALHNRALLMGLLGLNYALAGYALGRREVRQGALARRGGPFLTAVAFLSVVVVPLSWAHPATVTLLLAAVALLYLALALWLGWPTLFLPALVAVHLCVLTAQEVVLGYSVLGLFGISSGYAEVLQPETAYVSLDLAYAALAVLLLLVGLMLRKRGQARWAWPLYLAGGLDLGAGYLAGLVLGWQLEMQWLAVGLSALVALLLLSFAYLEREQSLVLPAGLLGEDAYVLTGLLTYLGLAAIFCGHFYAVGWAAGSRAWDVWPGYTAGLCALYVALSWLLRRDPLDEIYASPLRATGLCLMAVPIIALSSVPGAFLGTVVLAIAGVVFMVDAVVRRDTVLAHLGVGALFACHFYVIALLAGSHGWDIWPSYTAALCTLFVVLAWLFRRPPFDVWATPFRRAGLWLMVAPVAGAVVVSQPLLGVELALASEPLHGAVTFALAAAAYLAEAVVRHGTYLQRDEGPGRDEERLVGEILAHLGVGALFICHFYVIRLVAGSSAWNVWPGYTAGLCALFVLLAWFLHRGRFAVWATPLRRAGLWLMVIPIAGLLLGFQHVPGGYAFFVSRPFLGVATFLFAGAAYLADAALRRDETLAYLGVGAVYVSHFYLLGLIAGGRAWEIWPAYSAGLCALFVALAWLLRRPPFDVWATPFRRAGLWLMAVPIVGLFFVPGPLMGSVVLAIAAAAYLADAAVRRDAVLAHLGVGALFACHFYILYLVAGSRAWEIWPGYTAGLCLLFVALSWFLRHEPLDVWATPLRRAGLWLMAVPIVGAVVVSQPLLGADLALASEPLHGAVTFALAAVAYLADAVVRPAAGSRRDEAPQRDEEWLVGDLLAHLGVGALFICHFYVIRLAAGSSAWNVWPGYTAGLCALFVLLAWFLRRGRFQVWATPLRRAGLWLMVIPIAGLLLGFQHTQGGQALFVSKPFLGVVTFGFAGAAYLADAALRRDLVLAHLGVGAVYVCHFYLLGLIAGSRAWEIWPGYSAGLCALFVALAWLLRRPPFDVWAVPFRRAGLWLLAVPIVGLVFVPGPIMGGVVLAIAGAVYLAESVVRRAAESQQAATLRSDEGSRPTSVLAHLGVGALFACHFYLIGIVAGSLGWEIWPGYSAALCGLFVVLAWLLRRPPFDVWALPFRRAGLWLMAVPLLGSIFVVGPSWGLDAIFVTEPLLGAVTFAIAGAAYLADAVARRDEVSSRAGVLAHLGVGALYVCHFYVIGVLAGSRAWEIWPGYSAGLCGLFVVLAWLLRRGRFSIWATPLRRAGLWLMAAPLIGSLALLEPGLAAVTFGLAAAAYLVDAILHRNTEPRRALAQIYLTVGLFVIAIWALLLYLDVSELQFYVVPFGLAAVGVAWNERAREHRLAYWLLTCLGLGVLMVSAFVQSLLPGNYAHAILLAVESLLALGWGIWRRSRAYVLVGVLSLVANALTQFGRAFVEWPRWVQIGLTGAVLLGGGLAALFRREQILQTRQKLTEEWRQWEP